MAILVNCPSCQRQLRVPEELLGKKVKCPGCAITFNAEETPAALPDEGAPPKPRRSEREGFEEDRPRNPTRRRDEEEDDDDRPRRRRDEDEDDGYSRRYSNAKSSVGAPAIALMITGILNLIFSLCGMAQNVAIMAGAAIMPFQNNDLPAAFHLFFGTIG